MGLLKRAWRTGWKLAVVAAVAGLVIYRVRFAPVTVESHTVVAGSIVAETMGTGTLEARVRATISPKISGLVTQVLADQGDRVNPGQLLVTLDDGDLRQQVEIARAELAATGVGVDRAEAEIVSAQANVVQALSSYARYARLMPSQAASESDMEKATQQRDVAEADLRRARIAKIETQRQVNKAEDSLRYYQERLTDTRITSPFAGLVVQRSREPGDIVVPGSPILQVISTEQMWVSAWVDESAMADLAVGQSARVVFRSEPAKSYRGVLTRIAPQVDSETREFLVDVTVKDLPAIWAVGQRAEVYIQTASKESVLFVPARAIVRRDAQPGVWVSNAGHARWRDIVPGLRGADRVEVTGGLTAGEQVVWLRDSGGGPLTEGRAVTPGSAP